MTILAPAPAPTTPLDVDPLSPTIGVAVDARRLGDLHAPETTAQLRSLVTAHHVVFIRGADLSAEDFAWLAASFGPLTVHPLKKTIGSGEVVSTITDDAERPPAAFPWHTDLSWLDAPPRFGFLQALEIPPSGGDTLFVDLTAAYETLPAGVRAFYRRLWLRHEIDDSLARSVRRHQGRRVAARLARRYPGADHPLVRAHPDTGRPTLYLSPMYVTGVTGFSRAESQKILGDLHRLVENPRFAVRWQWAEGDIAIWDETCTVHKALGDHFPSTRRMRRCTVEGPEPVRALSDR